MIAINSHIRRIAALLRRAADAEQDEAARRFDLQHAQVASWLAGHPAEMQPDVRAAFDAYAIAAHRAETARHIANRALRHGQPTGRRPVWGNASKPLVIAAALDRRMGQLWTARIGFLAATPKTRQPSRPAIFAQTGQ